jgi:deoxycytidylate deaminase
MAPKRTYRTSQGKSVDLGALLLQNENVRAVGNMGVNARGDRIDNKGKVVDSKVQQTKRQYNKQIGPVDEIPATSRRAVEDVSPAPVAPDPYVESVAQVKKTATAEEKAAAKAAKTAKKKTTTKKVAKPVIEEVKSMEDVDINNLDNIESNLKKAEEPKPLPSGGLADAIARARTIKQEEAKTPRQKAQEKAGVRKI